MNQTRWLRILAPALTVGFLGFFLSGCERSRPLREAELPSSHRNSTLAGFSPPEALDHMAEWYPGDWRVHLLLGITDTSREGKFASLRAADSLRPGDPLPAYHLALAYLGQEEPEEEKLARPHLEKALSLDPENGVLKVMLAYVLLREGRVPMARALFMDPRRIPRGTFYHPRLEEVVLGLFNRTRMLNPYSLTEAAALYRGIPLPPFEKMIDILYSVFLSPLEDRPYDIRIRGQEAAHAVFQLGRRLRVDSYRGSRVLSGGYEQRALGFMFQLKAAEFLAHFHRTFEDTAASRLAFDELVVVQKEYEGFMASGAWQDTLVTGYLDSWSSLIRENPAMSLGDAVEVARHWPLWRKAMRFRYPASDDPP